MWVALSPGCTCESTDAVDAGLRSGGLAPVPAPSGLVMTGVAPRPEELWQKFRVAIGGPVFFVPKSLGGAAVALLGLPLAAGPEFDSDVPLVFAARIDEQGNLQFVSALHVKAGDRLVGQLTRGHAPPFSSKEDAESQVTLLIRDSPSGSHTTALGVLGNYLLVGATQDDLRALGPYVARTLPAGPVPSEDAVARIPEAALQGPLVEAIRARVDRVASLPMPMAGLAFESLAAELSRDALSALGGMGSLEAKLVIDARAARFSLTAPIKEEASAARKLAAELSPGDARALRELPSHTLAALWVRQPREARLRNASDSTELIIRALGAELTEADRKEVQSALQKIAGARGDELAAGIGFGAFGPSAYARTDGNDEAALDEAMQRLLGLLELEPVRERLAKASLEAHAKPTIVERLPGDVHRLRFSRAKTPKDANVARGLGLPEKVDVLMLRQGATLYVAAGLDAPEALRSLVLAKTEDNLGGVPSFDAAIADFQEGTVASLMFDITGIVDRLRGKRPSGAPSVVALSFGVEPKGRSSLWLRADVARPAIGELTRWLDAM